MILNLFVAVGMPGSIQFVFPGHFLWKDPQVLIVASKGEYSLLIREPTKRLKFPSMVHPLKEFQTFAEEHKISLVGVNVDEVIEEMEARGRLMAGVGIGGYMIPLWIKATVRDGYSPELVALMTLSLFLFGHTEVAMLFIFCVSKNADKRLRQVLKQIWENTFTQ